MKKVLLVLTLVLGTLVSKAQSSNPIKLMYEKDQFTDKEYLMTESDLLVTNDGKKGFKIYPRFKKENGKWDYSFIGGVSTIGNCFENDKIYIIFEDGSKFDMISWRDFNCKGEIGFDLNGKFREDLSKPMKGIKFQNGRDYSSFEKIFTNPNDKNYFINIFKALDEYNAKH
jgi:hypothetical protein